MSIDEGIKALEALSRVNAEELGEYINAYAEKFQLSEKLSSDMYGSDMREAIDESREYMAKKLSEAGFIGQLQSSLDKIADAFADGGADSAEAFGTNFLNKIQAILQEAASSIQSFSAVADISGSLAASGGTSISNTNNSKSISISIKNTGNTSTAYQQRIETEKMLDKLAMQGVFKSEQRSCFACKKQSVRQIAIVAGSIGSSGFQWEIMTPTEILKWNPPPYGGVQIFDLENDIYAKVFEIFDFGNTTARGGGHLQ